jgi:hypothetical protein
MPRADGVWMWQQCGQRRLEARQAEGCEGQRERYAIAPDTESAIKIGQARVGKGRVGGAGGGGSGGSSGSGGWRAGELKRFRP